MPRIDPVIDRLLVQHGVEVFFHTGAVPTMRTLQTTDSLLKQPLDTAQIVMAFAEIVPAELRAHFPVEGTTRWTYAAPRGAVRVQFNKRKDKVSASVRPHEGDAAAPEVLHTHTPVPGSLPTLERHDGPAMAIPTQVARPVVAEPAPAAPKLPDAPVFRVVREDDAPAPADVSIDPAVAMRQLLDRMLVVKASDLHLSAGSAPIFRIDGDMRPDRSWPELPAERLAQMLWTIAPARNRQEWDERHDSDFAHETKRGRFRANLFADRKGIGAVFRHIPSQIRSASELNLSKAVLELCALSKGLVLVTGPTGSGKSTTLAAMIDHINQTRRDHIITIEDPIEFVHPNKKCLINQRECGVHTTGFKQALRAALREDPDVVLVGELRDLETMAIAIETAETGHLVFGTLHTNTACSTVDRIIDQFPADRQEQIRTMLSESLKGVVAQTLCKKIGGGRAAALEVLLVNGGVSNLIREGKTFQLESILQTSKSAGMSTLNDALLELVKTKVVEPKDALAKAIDRKTFQKLLEASGFSLEPASVESPPIARTA
jgi:twitching motility protein PilT